MPKIYEHKLHVINKNLWFYNQQEVGCNGAKSVPQKKAENHSI